MDRRLFAAVSAVVIGGVAGASSRVSAAPYASGVTEAAGVVSFRLNEDADEVVVVRDGTPQSLGALGPGVHNFNRSGAAQYQIVVNRNAAQGFVTPIGGNTGVVLQISNDANPLVNFLRTPGIAVSLNPNNGERFGRIYVTSPIADITFSGRALNDGVYILNSDFTDALGQGNNAFTAGIDWTSGGTAAAKPWRMDLDEAGNVYIADWSDETGTVWRTGPDVGNSGGTNLLVGLGGDASAQPFGPTNTKNHGSVGGLAVTGSTDAGNLTLYTIDEDMSPTATPDMLNGLWRYNVGATTSGYDGIPTFGAAPLIDDFATGGIIVDLARGPDGKLYMMQSRFAGTETGIAVIDSDEQTVIYDSLTDTIDRGIDIVDVFRLSRSIEVSPDGQYLAINTSNGGDTWIVPLLDGIPDMPNRLLIDTFFGIGDGAAFDAAGNLYVGNRDEQLLRAFSPGGPTQTIFTSNGSASFTARQGPQWDVSGGGNYSNSANWLLGVVPSGNTARATFGAAVSGAATVTLDQNVTLADVRFEGPGSYTIAGANTLTLESVGEPRITVQGGTGNHTISAPVVTNQNIQFTVTPPTSTLTVSNFTQNNPGATITTAGAGTTALNRFVAATLNIRKGVAKVLPSGTSAATSRVGTLNIAGGSAPSARLDITDNAFVVDYSGASPLPEIEQLITSAYAGGAWTGNGIGSSNANGSTHGVGYAEASELGTVPAIFGSVDSTAVLFRLTRYGDANLDGLVNLSDFNRLAANFGSTDADWVEGDFTYDNTVNLADFNRLAANFGLSAGPEGPTPDDWANLAAAVPEPGSAALLAIGPLTILTRRRRCTAK